MKTSARWFGLTSLLAVLALLVAACGGAAATPAAPTEQASASEAMMHDDTDSMASSDESMMQDDTDSMASGDETMMQDESDSMASGDKTMMQDESDSMASGDESMMQDESDSMAGSDETMMDVPDWFGAELTDVNSGQTFRLSDLNGKVVLVETMAIWCSNCLRQQKEVKALHETMGMNEDLVTVALDIDANENADDLKAYAAKNGFDWTYAVAPRDVAREIGQLYGEQFLNPPSTPILIVDRHGEAHPLPFGIKSAESLQESLAQFLSDGM